MENLTGGTPPVRPLPCVVPCKLYFADGMSFDAGTWDEKITDTLNYLFLLKAIVKEGQTNQQN